MTDTFVPEDTSDFRAIGVGFYCFFVVVALTTVAGKKVTVSKAAWSALSHCGQPGIPPRPISGQLFICRQGPLSQEE